MSKSQDIKTAIFAYLDTHAEGFPSHLPDQHKAIAQMGVDNPTSSVTAIISACGN